MSSREGAAWRVLLLMVLWSVAFVAAAATKVDPGEVPLLKPGEGLLVIGVDSDTALASC